MVVYLNEFVKAITNSTVTTVNWCGDLNCESDSGLSTGAIVGIAVGGFVLLVIIIGVIVYCCKRKGNADNTQDPE